MNRIDPVRSLIKDVAPYLVICAVLGAAKAGVPETLCSLVAGGLLVVIDPRRGNNGTTTVTTDRADQTTVTTEPKP